ncbi:hypothetical protein T492DRAFT_842552 [Pavlovales sp. CCMP2436]|nr:hypothetical protein T492DRAFT_842552 [Pavlovales sp. CCMP2436]
MSTPWEPRPVAFAQDGVNGCDMLRGAHSVAVAMLSGKPHAVVTAYMGGGIQLIDISRPTSPSCVSHLPLPGAQSLVIRAQPGGEMYALVAQYDLDRLQTIDISDPREPTAVSEQTHGARVLELLEGLTLNLRPTGLDLFTSSGTEYALVTLEAGDGLQLLNVTEARAPSSVSALHAGKSHWRMLRGAASVAVVTASENCTLASYYFFHSVLILSFLACGEGGGGKQDVVGSYTANGLQVGGKKEEEEENEKEKKGKKRKKGGKDESVKEG